jgi:hypothetical protein
MTFNYRKRFAWAIALLMLLGALAASPSVSFAGPDSSSSSDSSSNDGGSAGTPGH